MPPVSPYAMPDQRDLTSQAQESPVNSTQSTQLPRDAWGEALEKLLSSVIQGCIAHKSTDSNQQFHVQNVSIIRRHDSVCYALTPILEHRGGHRTSI